MNPEPENPTEKEYKRGIGYYAACFMLLVLFSIVVAPTFPFFFEIPSKLLTGWAPFLRKVVPQTQPNVSLLVSGIFSLLLVYLLAIFAGKAILRWTPRKTALSTTLFLLLFIPAVAMTGIIRHSMGFFSGPVFERSRNHISSARTQVSRIQWLVQVYDLIPDGSEAWTSYKENYIDQPGHRIVFPAGPPPAKIAPGEPRFYFIKKELPDLIFVATSNNGDEIDSLSPHELPPRVQQLLWGSTVKPAEVEP